MKFIVEVSSSGRYFWTPPLDGAYVVQRVADNEALWEIDISTIEALEAVVIEAGGRVVIEKEESGEWYIEVYDTYRE